MTLSYVKVAEWSPFGRELHIRFAVCSLRNLTDCSFSYSHFGFEGGTLVLI